MTADDHPPARVRWHVLALDEAVAKVGSDAEHGLSEREALARLESGGRNVLPEVPPRTLADVLLHQLRSPLIYLLLGAGLIAFALGHTSDAVVIAIVVIINTVIGALQEGRAERSLQALRRLAAHKAHVVRDGVEAVIDAADVTQGDVIVLQAGDAVVADARLLDRASLQIAEAALTGESVPVSKDLLPLAPDTPLAERRNMVYAGTHVTAGRARAVVVAVGQDTQIGHIARLAESAKEPATPLEQRIARLGRSIMFASAWLFAIVLALGTAQGIELSQIAMIAISQVVGLIPEGLPVAMTVALALGVQRMARRRALVRRLSAVETLGSTTIVCTDKTGTLTKNEMTAQALELADGRSLQVTGVGYEPSGEIKLQQRSIEPQDDPLLRELLEAAILCNDASVRGPTSDPEELSPRERRPRWEPIGDPTEVALVTLAMKAGMVPIELRASLPRRAEIPFDAASKLMATEHETPDGPRIIVKGAPEVVLELCGYAREADGQDAELDDDVRRRLGERADALAARALRVLAFAVVAGRRLGEHGSEALKGRATLLGMIGQIDPPRPEVKDAVARCLTAGIRPVMVTGDHKATAIAIAEELGIAEPGSLALDGRELERMSAADLDDCIEQIRVFARVHPAQKLRIVRAYQKRGAVVAMTGDGVNDAPALVQADVGIAMGVTGTDVAKQAAKIVIEDDNFATIVAAVEEGRAVYRNIKKAMLLLLSTSIAEVAVLLLALALGYPPPFLAVQILWNNLITEGLITVNLAMEPKEQDEMKAQPIARDQPIFTRLFLGRLALMVVAIAAVVLGWLAVRTSAGVPEALARTEAFTLLAICEWFNVLSCRSQTKSALTSSLLDNRWLLAGMLAGMALQAAVVYWRPLGALFYTVPISALDVLGLIAAGSVVLWAEELRKLIARSRSGSVQHEPAL